MRASLSPDCRHAKFPAYPERHVYKVSNDTKVYVGDELTETFAASGRSHASNRAGTGAYGSPPRKRAHHGAAPPPAPSAPKRNAMSAFMLGRARVPYSGAVTGLLPGGRLQLDGNAYLHLSGNSGWLHVGRRTFACLRTNARIEANQVRIGDQLGKPTTQCPMAGTTVSILYFGTTANGNGDSSASLLPTASVHFVGTGTVRYVTE